MRTGHYFAGIGKYKSDAVPREDLITIMQAGLNAPSGCNKQTTSLIAVEEHFDHLDMLVNNAGVGDNAPGMESLTQDHHFYDIPLSTFKTIVETNFTGDFLVSSKFVPLMVKNGHGSVVYVSTSTDTMTRKGQLPYGPSKVGAEAMSAILSKELQDAFIQNNMPILKADVMNKALLFLASPKAKGITGEKIIGKDFDKWLEDRDIIF